MDEDDNSDDDDDYSDDDDDDEEIRDFSESKVQFVCLCPETTQRFEAAHCLDLSGDSIVLIPRESLRKRKKETKSKKNKQQSKGAKAAEECIDVSGDLPVSVPLNLSSQGAKKVTTLDKKKALRRELLLRVGTWGGEEALSTTHLSGKSHRESCLIGPYRSFVINRQIITMSSSLFRRKYDNLLTRGRTATFSTSRKRGAYDDGTSSLHGG